MGHRLPQPGPEPKVAVIGLGLIGGSILRATVERRAARRVAGWSRSPETLEAVREAGLGECVAGSLEEACRDATLAVIATPVRAIPALADRARRAMAGGDAVVTDVGSTKDWVMAQVARLAAGQTANGWSPGARPTGGGGEGSPLRPLPPFVGGHPVAGTDRSGFGASTPDLFEGQAWLVVPPSEAPAAETAVGAPAARAAREGEAAGSAVRRAEGFARALGARPVVVSAAEHDRLLAATSHLPYLLAVALALTGQARAGEVPTGGGQAASSLAASLAPFAGGGFRDGTRLARQDPVMGLDTLATNLSGLEAALAEVRAAAAGLLAALRDNPDLASRLLAKARDFRDELGRVKRWDGR